MATKDQIQDALGIVTEPSSPGGAPQSAAANVANMPQPQVDAPTGGPKLPQPSLSAYQQKIQEIRENNPVYSETAGAKLADAVFGANPAMVSMNRLGVMEPEGRAQTGSRFGAAVGLAAQGPMGAVLGSGLGAMVGRSLGLIQSGQHEDNVRKKRVLDALDNLGIRDAETGIVGFEDGGAAAVTPDRVFGNEAGDTGPASLEVVNSSSPFVRRTTTVARPIARYIAEGLLGYQNPEDDRDSKTVDTTTSMLVNTLQDGATNIDTVYNRAREMAAKLGITGSQARAFFHVRRANLPEIEQAEINKGLDIIYG